MDNVFQPKQMKIIMTLTETQFRKLDFQIKIATQPLTEKFKRCELSNMDYLRHYYEIQQRVENEFFQTINN
jgi:hypothetical protein